ncbi:signal recognition particle-docking protein FtsY [Halobacillus naozhouensis]|uniref:Signal recognition particle receptor FtsY n=1 Tax=Halobacillus naozhouensis TaxID=554880 RepID=A0ABY8J2J0_9BACI|nr:signal recognition particle-docking protein FtsY [Halobacillus naozhouensis]WFT76710.1 signal recognition particle-docking protein FtsY [Halobacillus naozhouensis]
MSFFKKLKEKFVQEPMEKAVEDSLEQEEEKNQSPLEHEETEEEAESLEGETEVQEAGEDLSEEPVLETDAGDEPEQTDAEEEVQSKESNIASKFKMGLTKTRDSFTSKINDLVARYRTVDEDFFEELEEVLISADVGVNAVMEMIDELEMEVKRRNIKDTQLVKEVISEKLVELYYGDDHKGAVEELQTNADGLTIYLFVGVNGVGKTTTIGKLAHQLKTEGKKVTLAAGDTFRAGAIDQLDEWGKRAGVNVIKHSEGSDPAAVIYDGIQSAKSKQADVLICDTAGRLQNKVNLMNELSKVKRVIEREVPGAPHEVLLVLDATTGQNAMSQAKTFSEATDVSGIVLTKLDGTAKGGIVLAIRNELEIPVKLVGLGEKVSDLETFDAHAFVYGLFADMIEEQTEEE